MGLQVSKDLTLPDDAVTETFGLVATKGAGKTNTAVVMAEEIHKIGQPFIMLDPMGTAWGMRLDKNGKAAGLPVVIFGGSHGDVPLKPESGEMIARVIVEKRFSALIDVSEIRRAQFNQFMTAFLETLYHYNRQPLHLIVDEADLVAPQVPDKDQNRMLDAMDDIVRRGRHRGLGCTIITQRPAVVHKNVMSMVSCMMLLRIGGPQDRKAIVEWVKYNTSDLQMDEMMKDLAALPVGRAWVWSPGWLKLVKCVQIRARQTFDSSKTPKVGENRPVTTLAPIDIEALGQQMQQLKQDKEENDPIRLKSQVARLRDDLAYMRKTAKEELLSFSRTGEFVKLPLLANMTGGELLEFSVIMDEVKSKLTGAVVSVEMHEKLREIRSLLDRGVEELARINPVSAPQVPRPAAHLKFAVGQNEPLPPVRPAPPCEDESEVGIRAGMLRILEALKLNHPEARSRAAVALYAGMSKTSGTFTSYISVLKKKGKLEVSGDMLRMTEEGLRLVANRPTASGGELYVIWRQKMRAGAAQMMDKLKMVYPELMTRAELAESVGMSVTSGTFTSYLSVLSTAGVIVKDGNQIRLSEHFV